MNLRERFTGLRARDRQMLVGGALVVLVLLTWAWAVDPLLKQRARLRADLPTQRAALAEMRAQVASLKANATTSAAQAVQPIPGSLLSFIDTQARAAGLGDALKRLEPAGEQAVRLTLERAEFERLAGLLDQLRATYGLEIGELGLNADASPGQVSGQLKLERRGG
jgi:general secretion pathway protein M